MNAKCSARKKKTAAYRGEPRASLGIAARMFRHSTIKGLCLIVVKPHLYQFEVNILRSHFLLDVTNQQRRVYKPTEHETAMATSDHQ